MAQRYIKIRYAIRFFYFLYLNKVSIKIILANSPSANAHYTGYYEGDVQEFPAVM